LAATACVWYLRLDVGLERTERLRIDALGHLVVDGGHELLHLLLRQLLIDGELNPDDREWSGVSREVEFVDINSACGGVRALKGYRRLLSTR
jgi:hypothetical protein